MFNFLLLYLFLYVFIIPSVHKIEVLKIYYHTTDDDADTVRSWKLHLSRTLLMANSTASNGLIINQTSAIEHN